MSDSCRNLIEVGVERRPANALNLEIGTPLARCILKRPEHWPDTASSLRWIGSGGSPLVFGACEPNRCPHAAPSHEMNDPHAKAILNTAAYNLGNALAQNRVKPLPAPMSQES